MTRMMGDRERVWVGAGFSMGSEVFGDGIQTGLGLGIIRSVGTHGMRDIGRVGIDTIV